MSAETLHDFNTNYRARYNYYFSLAVRHYRKWFTPLCSLHKIPDGVVYSSLTLLPKYLFIHGVNYNRGFLGSMRQKFAVKFFHYRSWF